jgi:hypothetical protein
MNRLKLTATVGSIEEPKHPSMSDRFRQYAKPVGIFSLDSAYSRGISDGLYLLGERLAHPRRGRKPEFKQERYPPLDAAACSLIGSVEKTPLLHPRRISIGC